MTFVNLPGLLDFSSGRQFYTSHTRQHKFTLTWIITIQNCAGVCFPSNGDSNFHVGSLDVRHNHKTLLSQVVLIFDTLKSDWSRSGNQEFASQWKFLRGLQLHEAFSCWKTAKVMHLDWEICGFPWSCQKWLVGCTEWYPMKMCCPQMQCSLYPRSSHFLPWKERFSMNTTAQWGCVPACTHTAAPCQTSGHSGFALKLVKGTLWSWCGHTSQWDNLVRSILRSSLGSVLPQAIA